MCKIEHNHIAPWIFHNGRKVTGFCSDECIAAYRAKYPDYDAMATDAAIDKKMKGKGLAGKILGGIGKAAMRDVKSLFGG
jgi:hypothetical protein